MKSLLLKSNNPRILCELEEMNYKRSELCNDGIFILLHGDQIMLVNHMPYINHTDFGEDEYLFLKTAHENSNK